MRKRAREGLAPGGPGQGTTPPDSPGGGCERGDPAAMLIEGKGSWRRDTIPGRTLATAAMTSCDTTQPNLQPAVAMLLGALRQPRGLAPRFMDAEALAGCELRTDERALVMVAACIETWRGLAERDADGKRPEARAQEAARLLGVPVQAPYAVAGAASEAHAGGGVGWYALAGGIGLELRRRFSGMDKAVGLACKAYADLPCVLVGTRLATDLVLAASVVGGRSSRARIAEVHRKARTSVDGGQVGGILVTAIAVEVMLPGVGGHVRWNLAGLPPDVLVAGLADLGGSLASGVLAADEAGQSGGRAQDRHRAGAWFVEACTEAVGNWTDGAFDKVAGGLHEAALAVQQASWRLDSTVDARTWNPLRGKVDGLSQHADRLLALVTARGQRKRLAEAAGASPRRRS